MISVIICTYNRDKYIYNLLCSIAKNRFSYGKYEIVLIDNNCSDNTPEECRRFSTNYPEVNFRYLVETNQGLSFARNRGIVEALGNILIYVDDDATVNELFLETYYNFFEQHLDIAAAGGAVIPHYETSEPKWISYYTKRLITGYLYLGNSEKEFQGSLFPGGGNAAYRSGIFTKIGNFNTSLGRKGDSLIGAEEKDLFCRMRQNNMRFFYLPNAILYHSIPESKLSNDYFDKLTFSIGRSEKMRTLAISRGKYLQRIFSECIKWGGSIILFLWFTISFRPQKGSKILRFRYNVSRGLLLR